MEKELLEPEVTKKGEITFLPFMCDNSPSFLDIDNVISLLKGGSIHHKQREIWKMMPKKDGKGNIERNDKTGEIVMIKVVTRNSKTVTVKTFNGGLVSLLSNGKVEPMDFTDVREVVELLKQQQ